MLSQTTKQHFPLLPFSWLLWQDPGSSGVYFIGSGFHVPDSLRERYPRLRVNVNLTNTELTSLRIASSGTPIFVQDQGIYRFDLFKRLKSILDILYKPVGGTYGHGRDRLSLLHEVGSFIRVGQSRLLLRNHNIVFGTADSAQLRLYRYSHRMGHVDHALPVPHYHRRTDGNRQSLRPKSLYGYISCLFKTGAVV